MERRPNVERTWKGRLQDQVLSEPRSVFAVFCFSKINMRLVAAAVWTIIIFLSMFISPKAQAACGATVYTWDSGGNNNDWTTNNNWDPNGQPNSSSETAIVVSGQRNTQVNQNVTVSCVEVQSGELRSRDNRTLTITGDYFRSLTNGNLNITHANFWFDMAGAGAQTFENVDTITNLRISNNSSQVTLTNPFVIEREFVLTGANTTVYIDANVEFQNAAGNGLTIPSGVTLEITPGNTFTVGGNLTVNGTLKIDDGATLALANGSNLSVGSTGVLQLAGASGSVSTVTANGAGTTFNLSIAGIINANYFRLDRLSANGLNVTGTIQQLNNGEFHYLANAGYAITLGASASIPSSFNTVGFFDDDIHGNVQNINASNYSNSAATINNWSGTVGGTANENDPNDKITWGSQAGTLLSLSDNTTSGNPPANIGLSSTDTLFNTFAFSLNQASTTTSITSVTLTMGGTASANDIQVVKIYKDAGAGTNCVYDSGSDTQIGGNLTLTGVPPQATISIPNGDVQTSSDTDIACIHVLAATASNAQDAKTISFAISSTGDVTNSQGYSFSPSSGPPVSGGSTEIIGSTVKDWQGDRPTDNWTVNGNWRPSGEPNTTQDCAIGPAVDPPIVNIAQVVCQNATLQAGGEINFNSASNEFAIYGILDVQSPYTFSNAASSTVAMRGASNQTIVLSQAFPNNLIIANTGTSPNNVVSLAGNSTVNGSIIISSGVLSIPNGYTLNALGGVSVQSGGTLEIQGGGILNMGSGTTLTVNSGGILKVIGNAGNDAQVTSTGAYEISVNGEIQAKYYNFDHLGTNGVTIETGATVNTSYYFQNGSFTYPVNSSSTMLHLKVQIPGHTINDIIFGSAGSSATGVTNIDTTGASAGTLNIISYSGNLAGLNNDSDPAYNISWSGATNTVEINQEAIAPTTLDSGSTYNMGRFGFQQSLAGASYSDANYTNLTLTLLGTASGGDVDTVRIYYDSNCDSANGLLIGTGSFSGNPAQVSFAIGAGDLKVEADVSSPPKRCVYVEYDLAPGANNGKSVGVQLQSSTHLSNDQNYSPSGATTFPVTLGTGVITGSTSTTWLGTTNTNWFTPTNWSAGVPDSAKNCTINNVANDPSINGGSGTAQCKNVTIGSGVLTFVNGTGAELEVFGTYSNTGTVIQNDGVIRIEDGGAGTSQNFTSSSSTVSYLEIEKTGGGTVNMVTTSLTVQNLTFNSGNTSTFLISSGKTLVLPNGTSISNGTLEVAGGGTLQIGNGQTLLVNGGTFKTSGLSDSYPQNLAQKGKITTSGAGTWNFTATSGTVNLVGFQFDYVGTNGLNLGGSTTLANFESGHFTNLSESYSSLKVMQFNISNLPSTFDDIEWHWGPSNTPPAPADSYLLASSTGCGGNTLSFNNWWGDFFDDSLDTPDPDPNTKVSETNCDIVISWANSPVSLVKLDATGFEGEVLLEWATGLETGHLGFNVYRSQNPYSDFIQINDELVRNNFLSLGPQGSYHFIDNNVTNGDIYYYMIEDVATGGARDRHGPVSAIPLAGLGAAPPPEINENSTITNTDADAGNDLNTGPIANPGARDLGQGVHVLAQTYNSIRLEIIPPSAEYTASSWTVPTNGSLSPTGFESLVVPGYAKSILPGEPELAERVILIEIDTKFTNILLSDSSIDLDTPSSHRVQPAPKYTLDNENHLIPIYEKKTEAYENPSLQPAEYFSVESQPIVINNKSYVKVNIFPLKYDALNETVHPASKITLDIGLDGQAWAEDNFNESYQEAPTADLGNILIKISEDGIYELSFDEMAGMGLTTYLADTNINDLRLYWQDAEVPLEVLSSDSLFNSGDKIRFAGYKTRRFESSFETLVLTQKEYFTHGFSPLRFTELNVNPTSIAFSPKQFTEKLVNLEQDLLHLNDRSLGNLQDHLFWSRFARKSDNSATPYFPTNFSTTFYAPDLITDPSLKVRFDFYVRGRNQLSRNSNHHLQLWINNIPYPVDEKVFNDYYPTKVSFIASANQLAAGTNTLRLEIVPDGLKSGDWSIIDLDRIAIQYKAELNTTSDQITLYKIPKGESLVTTGFTNSQIKFYDLSNNEAPRLYSSVNVYSLDGNLTYNAELALPIGESHLGYRVLGVSDAGVLKPESLSLSFGYSPSIKNPTHQFDLIVIGFNDMLVGAEELIALRKSQGLRVFKADLEQIYAEFSYGIPDKQGIKDFLKYAFENWQSPKVKYVLFVGEATDDVRDQLNKGHRSRVIPAPLLSGDFIDYASLDWYADFDDDNVPEFSVGLLPAANSLELASMINKIVDYELGNAAPLGLMAQKYEFFADRSTYHEGFEKKISDLSNSLQQTNGKLQTSLQRLLDYTDEAAMNTAIKSHFENAPLILTYVGHGGEEQWGENLLNKSDINSLNNSRLPIVLGLNCRTGHFSQLETSEKSLGESLLLKEAGGAIAYWGSSSYTLPEAQVNLNKSFLTQLANSLKGTNQSLRLGDLVALAKESQIGKSSARETLNSWILLGDPSLKIPIAAYTPAQTTTSPPSTNHATSTSNSDKDGGGGCGLVTPPPGAGGSPWPPMGALVLFLPLALLAALRRRLN